MPRSHSVPYPIRLGTDSKIFLSLKDPERLVVFIHGFNGKSLGTWDDFPKHIHEETAFEHSDVLFYGYKSLRSQATVSAGFFREMLGEAADPATSGLFPERTGLAGGYQRIVIVAHSLGAIVTRYALLDALQAGDAWAQRVRMVLFAPAHLGATIGKVATECLSGPFKLLPFLAHTRYPVLQDLMPNSQCLTQLLTRSQHVLQTGPTPAVQAHTVIWAQYESVVTAGQFCNDPPAKPIADRDHTSICKPKHPAYLTPLQIVAQAL